MTVKTSYEIAQTLKGSELRLIGDWTAKDAADMPRRSVDRISLNARHGWVSKGDIGFLCRMHSVRSLKIDYLKPIDLQPLSKLKELRHLQLNLHPKLSCRFDFGDVPSLCSLRICWNKGFTGIRQLTRLNHLIISELVGVDELDLSGLSSLTSLELVTSRTLRAVLLDGVESLRELTLMGLPRLERVEGFRSGDSVQHLCVRGLNKMNATFWKAFSALDVVETTTRDPIEKFDFAVPPKSLLRLPL